VNVMIIGSEVLAAREAHHWTHAQVAARMRRGDRDTPPLPGTDAVFVRLAERNLLYSVRADWALALAVALGTDLVALTGGEHLRVLL